MCKRFGSEGLKKQCIYQLNSQKLALKEKRESKEFELGRRDVWQRTRFKLLNAVRPSQIVISSKQSLAILWAPKWIPTC